MARSHPRIQITEDPECIPETSEDEHRALLERLAARFGEPEEAGIDWELMREGKQRAWPNR
ncbi:MAG TPA: hypothetical protein VL972_08910 [Solirubrobacteraceae bacterium]|nr:hypothetical protein [Solirubrobacteraceae bacterium]